MMNNVTCATKKLIVLVGPTGVGKTALSIHLAQQLNTCIVSSDSRQLYKELVIGTAAPTLEEQKAAPHHFIGTLSLTDNYSAAQYEVDAMKLLQKLFIQKDYVILSGGSMLYIDALCNGIDDIPSVDAETRAHLLKRYEKEGLERLCDELRIIDPDYYAIVDQKNHKRVIHALEIYYITGKTFTSFRKKTIKQRPFEIIKIGLKREREELYTRINQRVDQMIADGLIEEARSVFSQRHLNSLNTVGYKELFAYFDGTCDLAFAIEKIKQHSRVYSKKQMTWFRKDPAIHWFHPENEAEIMAFVKQQL